MSTPVKNTVPFTVSIVSICFMSSMVNAQDDTLTLADVPFTNDAVTLVYAPSDGNLSVNSGGSVLITTFELVSLQHFHSRRCQ